MGPFPAPTSTWHTKAYDSISPSRPELSAKGKAVLITGGGTGIGAETARAFAEAGASRIALLGRRKQPLLDTKASIEEKYPNVDVFVASAGVSKKSEVDEAFATFVGDGKIDVVISNAAVEGPKEPISVVDGGEFGQAFHVLLHGALFVAQAFLRHAAAKDAVAIDINSSAAHVDFGSSGQYGTYSAAKLAVFRLWDSMASANPNVRVFHVQPGIVATEMNGRVGGVAASGIEDAVSLPARFNVWLASDEAHFAKNKFLWANWDVDELKAKAKEIEGSPLLSIGLVGWPFGNEGFATDFKF